jgi:hypothetical protein
MAPVGIGVIRVRRTEAGRDNRKAYRILVDGEPMGSVARGTTRDIEVSAGDHTVIVSGGEGYDSEPLDLTVREGEVLRLRCMPAVTTATTLVGLMWGKQPKAGIRIARDDDG